LFKVFLEA